MASRILQTLFIVVVILVLVLVEADRYRRDDSSGGSGSSSGGPIRRHPHLPNRRTQIDQRNGRPNGVRGPGPRTTNQRFEGRSNPTSQTRGTSVRNNQKQSSTKKQTLAKGRNRVPESIPRTNAKTSPSSQKQSTRRRNLPKNRKNNVGGKKKKTPAKPNTNKKRQTRTNKRSSDSASSGCCSSSRGKGSEQIPPITPPTKSPTAGVPPIRSSEESQETFTSRDDAGGRDHSKEYPKQTEGPRGNDSKEDEATEDEMGEDGEKNDEETEDQVTTVDDSAGYTISTEIATVTSVTEFITSNNTVTKTTTPRHRDITETTTPRHFDVTETTTPTNRDVTETTTPPNRDVTENTTPINCDVFPPVPVRRERSIVFCAADRQKGISKCPCSEKNSLPVLPQFPMTECKFRKPNDIAIPIGINVVETNKRNTYSHTSAAYFITIVALIIVSFTV
ncbi:hypothetical protein HOLleu_04944 [Holothuria leucospilota]|uniref:Uncharacterized protein n=1 Tax=Holothuria leucospilota TaxID=206669 RepID=A0A9Q1CKA5_HOLLE|nr:hypothetical protein HOLleu_04944 [Holothuria leucospilota]